LLLREQMVMIQIVGAALILAGALILQLNPHRPSQTAAQSAGD
jgi:drug/metabolite transporter (DMT)-like permease